MSKIELSIIIPTHKRRDLLFFELDHIYMQKDVEFEVIVVNDIEEPDATDEITSRYPEVIYIKDSSIQGPSNKHKAGYKIAKGDYLYMPDDDDYLIDNMFFRKAIDKMIQDPTLAFVSGQCHLSYEYEDIINNELKSHCTNMIGLITSSQYLQGFQNTIEKPWSTVSTIFSRKAFDDTDAMNMLEMSDSSMYMQVLFWGNAFIMKDVVAVYRIKAGSLTSTLSLHFMQNVLRQKELFYKKSIGVLTSPKNFWYNQYAISYNFFPNLTRSNSWKLILWGLIHFHGSINLLRFLFFVFRRDVMKIL